MSRKFIRGMATGAFIGISAGMLLIPQMDRATRKKLRRGSKNMIDTVENVYDTFVDLVK